MTLVIPVYNQEDYLSEAIESALEQTVKFQEIIVVDDGSTDNSGKIADKYLGQVKVIHQVNKGLASARNTGIMNARTEYVCFLDADDILMETFSDKISQKIFETGADVIAPSFREFGMSNREVILMNNPKIADFKEANRVGYCTAIRKSALLEIGGYSPRMTWGYEDLHLWFNLLNRDRKIVTIPEVLWMYRVKKESMITTAQKYHDELMAQIKKDFPNI